MTTTRVTLGICSFCVNPRTGSSLYKLAYYACPRCGKLGCERHKILNETDCQVKLQGE